MNTMANSKNCIIEYMSDKELRKLDVNARILVCGEDSVYTVDWLQTKGYICSSA